jgi:flagellar hook-length control protein FliK
MAPSSPSPSLSLLGVASDPAKFAAAQPAANAATDGAAQAGSGFQLLMAQAVQEQSAPQQFLQNLLALTAGQTEALKTPVVAPGKSLPPTGAALPDGVPDKLPEELSLDQLALAQLAQTADGENPVQSDAEKSDDAKTKDDSADDSTADPALQLLLNPLTQLPAPTAAPQATGNAVSTAATAATAATDIAVSMLGNGGTKNAAATAPLAGGNKSTQAVASDAQAQANSAALPVVGIGANVLAKSAGDDKASADADFATLVKQLDSVATTSSSSNSSAPVGSSADTSRDVATRQYQNAAGGNATVSVPVGKAGWSDAVVDKVMWFSAQNINSAEIHLNPPDLGPLQVRISTHHDQTSVFFTSQHAAVRDALDQALPRLREMMDGSGAQLLDVGVGGQGAAQQQAHRGDERSGFATAGALGGDVDADEVAATTRVAGPRVSISLVDAYV